MKQNKFKLLLIIFLIIISTLNVYAESQQTYLNEETNFKIILKDDANLLTKPELEKLKKEIIPLTKHCNVVFKTTKNGITDVSYYATNLFKREFESNNAVLFLIDMERREIYIHSDGEALETITKNKALIITDNVYKYATKGQFYECASNAFSQINTLLQGGKISSPMRTITNILFSISISFLIGYIIVLISTKIKKEKNSELLKNCNVTFNLRDMQVLQTGTHKEYNPSSSSSSGGSSGGGGGGSSGGGGGHSF